VSDRCNHAHIDVVWSNAVDARDAAALPYGHPILQQGACVACGIRFERRHRIDAWGPWLPSETSEGTRDISVSARDGATRPIV
jgi:hypothetical protein